MMLKLTWRDKAAMAPYILLSFYLQHTETTLIQSKFVVQSCSTNGISTQLTEEWLNTIRQRDSCSYPAYTLDIPVNDLSTPKLHKLRWSHLCCL